MIAQFEWDGIDTLALRLSPQSGAEAHALDRLVQGNRTLRVQRHRDQEGRPMPIIELYPPQDGPTVAVGFGQQAASAAVKDVQTRLHLMEKELEFKKALSDITRARAAAGDVPAAQSTGIRPDLQEKALEQRDRERRKVELEAELAKLSA